LLPTLAEFILSERSKNESEIAASSSRAVNPIVQGDQGVSTLDLQIKAEDQGVTVKTRQWLFCQGKIFTLTPTFS